MMTQDNEFFHEPDCPCYSEQHSIDCKNCECQWPKCTVPPVGWTCSRKSGHDGPCASSRAAVPVEPNEISRTDLEKSLLNALYEVMPYLNETSRYQFLAPICHAALRLAGDDWASIPVEPLTEQKDSK